MPNIIVNNAALADDGDEIVLRGEIDPTCFQYLKLDTYQREFLNGVKLRVAVNRGDKLTDVVLGMRGQKFTSKGHKFLLHNDVYIIDGSQRIRTLLKWMADNPGKLPPPQGAKILFDTDWDSERDSFNTLGMTATRISANIFLRNERDKHPAIAAIYGLTRNAKLESPLFKRVGWNQRMAIGEIFTALLVVNVAAVLNRPPKVSTSANDGKKGMSALDKIAEDVGLQQFKDNVDTFFEVLDDVWGIRAIHYTQLATHIKRNFMIALAHVFATHTEFWHGKRLFVSSDIRGRLKSFPTTDPTVSQLSRSGSSVRPMLVSMIIEHLNKNKSANKLVLKDIPLGKEMKGKGKSKSNGMAAQHADLS